MVNLTENIELRCVRNASGSNKKFRYEKVENGSSIIFSQSNQSPTESTKSSELHIFIKKSIKDSTAPNQLDEKVAEIKNQLEESIIDEEALQNNEAYREIDAPPTINTRYIFEDVPNGLVPVETVGKEFGVPTPNITTIINMACSVMDTDYRKTGRRFTSEQLKQYF